MSRVKRFSFLKNGYKNVLFFQSYSTNLKIRILIIFVRLVRELKLDEMLLHHKTQQQIHRILVQNGDYSNDFENSKISKISSHFEKLFNLTWDEVCLTSF